MEDDSSEGSPGSRCKRRVRDYFQADPARGVLAAYLFGSHAEGRAHRESDVDVGVLLDRRRFPERDARQDVRLRLTSDLIHVTGVNRVDVVILNDAPPELGRHVVTRGVRVFCADAEADHAAHQAGRDQAVTFLVERLAELRRYVDHAAELRGRVRGPDSLRDDLSLFNDVAFTFQTIAQLVIDIAGELGARRGLRFEDYTESVRNLATFDEFPDDLVERLALLPAFRNVVVYDYIALDLDRVTDALENLQPVEDFLRIVSRLESG